MKLAIMQPYLLPYLGYFQLIRAVDAFVVYDDVNYIKGGWINRNYMLVNHEKCFFRLPLQGASSNKLINQIEIGGRHKILKSFFHSYGKAPYFGDVYPMLEDIFSQQEKNLANFLNYQLRLICDYLGIKTAWYISSELDKDADLHGQNKVLAICELLQTDHYINMPGGKALYSNETFACRGMKLSFIEPRLVEYRQHGGSFVPGLSIVDVMMFNSRERCAALLEAYDLV